MKYYLLRHSSDPKVTGIRDGGMQAEIKEKYYGNPGNYTNLVDFFMSSNYWKSNIKYPSFEVEVHAKLVKSAKETDFLDYGPDLMTCPFMLSDKVAEIFDKFNISDYKLYPVVMHSYHGISLEKNYYLFCCPVLDYEVIDFEKSVLYTGSDLLKNKKYYPQIVDIDTFQNEKNSMFDIFTPEVLAFNDKFDSSLDYFQCRIGGIQISQSLKDALTEAGGTGINILDIGPKIITTLK